MYISSAGDLAQSYSMQSRNAALKQDIQRLTIELASGKVSDVRAAVGGNTAYLNDIERSLTKLDGFELATSEAAQFAEGMQTALERIGDLNNAFRNTILTSSNSALGVTTAGVRDEATQTLGSVISAMNTNVAGRSLFAGTATDTSPIVPTDSLLSALTTAIAGAGSVDDMIVAAQSWFDDPAGFGSVAYVGSDTALSPITLSDEDTVKFDVRANDPVFRDTLRNLALIAVSGDPALGLTEAQQNEVIEKTTSGVLSANDAIVNLQKQIGFSEGQIEALTARHSTERASLLMAQSDLLSIDPFQTATELEQVQFQLQSLYAITSRMSQLSLVNYL